MDVVDADAPLLEVARLPVSGSGRAGSSHCLEPVDVAGAPACPPRSASRTGAARSRSCRPGTCQSRMLITCRTPRLFLAARAAPDRLVEEQPERPVRDGLGRKAANAVGRRDVPNRRRPSSTERDDRLREREPALRVEHEVVLEALRDQDVPGLVALGRRLDGLVVEKLSQARPSQGIQRPSHRRVKAHRRSRRQAWPSSLRAGSAPPPTSSRARPCRRTSSGPDRRRAPSPRR